MCIEAKDFRIGNAIEYLNPENEKWEIAQVEGDDISLFEGENWIKEHRGVVITDEILRKLGLDDKEYKEGYIGIDVQHSSFTLTKPKMLNNTFDNYVWEFKAGGWERIKVFKYVHQLQNFYFALTGEELTFIEE